MPTIPKRTRNVWDKERERTPNMNSHLYSIPYWRDIRKSFWNLPESQICAMCHKAKNNERYWTIDHKEPLPVPCTITEFIELSAPSMLQALCPKCNPKKTALDKYKK